mgnify:FL=1|tara:strand:+ start:1516 stop:2427 length:912 start_codon:yes stop_codon:yes gene_type:complete
MKKTFIVNESFNDMRLDRWIKNNIIKLPQSLIEKKIRIGSVKINNKKVKSSTKVKTNDVISLFNFKFSENKRSNSHKFKPSSTIIKSSENQIIDNNDDFIILNKPSGISVQGGTKSKKNIIDIFSKSEIFKDTKPFSVHRLDKDTSGIFIIAKNRRSAQLFTSLFRLRKIHKFYLAICCGEIEKSSGELNSLLSRYENNKEILEKAKTFYKVLDKNYNCTLLEMRPITGRKHQLRKQLFYLGNSIYGDNKYRISITKNKSKKLMLHSYKIKFMLNEKKYTYTANPPDYFLNFLKNKNLKLKNF